MKEKTLLKELIIGDLIDKVYAISLVKYPAIEENFLHFKKIMKFQDEDIWYYSLKPEHKGESLTISTSHKLCVSHAFGERVGYTIDQIKSWSKNVGKKDEGFTPNASAWFANFPGNPIDHNAMNLPLYGCRHYMKKKTMFHNYLTTKINFEVSNKPRRIVGPVMIANKTMLRPPEELDNKNYGYVWYSNKTLEEYFNRFGKKSNATFLHEVDITKNLLLTKSWIDKSDKKHWKWMCEYLILSNFIWDQIKSGGVAGFSVEIVSSMI